MPTLVYFKIWCTTDSKYEYVWKYEDDLPTTCPTNTAHTIDADSIVGTKSIKENEFKLIEEGVEQTGGFIAGTSRVMGITGATGETQNFDYTYPITVGIQSISFTSTAIHEGDEMEIIIAPNTVVGVLTADAVGATNIFNVSSTATAALKKGYYVNITDGANVNELGMVVDVNTATGKITTSALSDGTTFAAASPTYVIQNIKMLQTWTFGPGAHMRIGDDKTGASIIPANVIARVAYKNNSGTAKTFIINTELLY